MLINEVELSIYRFLASKAKMLKSRLDRMISHWAINAWQVIVKPRPILNRTLIGKTYPSTDNARLLEEK